MYCFTCKGSGEIVHEILCKSCLGTGKKPYGPGDVRSCEWCGGKGHIIEKKEKCKNCNGTGDTDNKKPFSI